MLRIALAVIAGFFAWLIVWVGNELALSALWPQWFGAQQRAFQAALENGDEFKPETSFLLTQVVCGALVSILSGFLTALIAGEHKRSELILGLLLTVLGLLKAGLSWPYVPLWYHLSFTAMLMPMTMLRGRLKNAANSRSQG